MPGAWFGQSSIELHRWWFDSQGQVEAGWAKHSDLAASVNYRKYGFSENRKVRKYILLSFNLLLVDE